MQSIDENVTCNIHNVSFNLYNQSFRHVLLRELAQDTECLARVEQSGSEGFYVEVIKWMDDSKWARFAFTKVFDLNFAKALEEKINLNSGMSKVFHLMTGTHINGSVPEDRALTALCIQEFVLEKLSSNTDCPNKVFWSSLQQKVGACKMRSLFLSLATLIDAAWSSIEGGEYYQDAFDWEFVPEILTGMLDKHGEAFIELPEAIWIEHAKCILSGRISESLKNELPSIFGSAQYPNLI